MCECVITEQKALITFHKAFNYSYLSYGDNFYKKVFDTSFHQMNLSKIMLVKQ